MKGYWYKFTVYVCPVCGKETWSKERQTTSPKPQDTALIYFYHQEYDGCQGY